MKIDWFAGMPAQTVRIAPQPVASESAVEKAPVSSRDALSLGGSYIVKHRDTLWGIAQRVLGDANRWPEVYALNRDKVGDPDLVFPGTVLKMPGTQHRKPAEDQPEETSAKQDEPATDEQDPAVRPHHEAPKPSHGGQPMPAVRPHHDVQHDEPAVSEATPAGDADYPTVGDYVKGRVSDAVDSTVDTLHGAAEIALPPLLLGEIAAIKASHEKAALSKIWNLPMDPQGKWKIQARHIADQESAKANAEIRALPGVRAVSAVGDAVVDGAVWTGHQVTRGANAVLDGMVATGEAVGEGVQWTGRQIETGARAVGTGIRAAGDAVVDSAVWVGHQAVEVPKAAARTTVKGIGGLGQSLVSFSRWALGGLD